MQPVAGDQFWEEMDPSLPFDDRLLAPNSPSLIHDGSFRILADSDNMDLELDGKIEQGWHPSPKARFIGISSGADHTIFTLLSKDFRSGNDELNYTCRLSRIQTLREGFECSGSIHGLLLKGVSMPIHELRFSLANFPEFLGVKVKSIDRNTGHRYSLDSMVVNGNGWTLRIDQRFKAGDLLAKVAASGGYISTHSCSLKRADGELFDQSRALDMISCLAYFFGFLAGRWCGPVLPVGLVNNTDTYEIYGSFPLTATTRGDSWFPLCHSLDVIDLLSGFLTLWDTDAWLDPLKQAIHWLVAANTNQNAIETSMVAAFVPIEMLCWLILVESEAKYSVKQFKQMQADAKLSELLRACNIPNSLPSHLTSLRYDLSEQGHLPASTALVEIRNAITHPRKTKREFLKKLSDIARYQAKELCLEFVELVLLKSMAYNGRYRRRAYGGWSGEEYTSVPWSN